MGDRNDSSAGQHCAPDPRSADNAPHERLKALARILGSLDACRSFAAAPHGDEATLPTQPSQHVARHRGRTEMIVNHPDGATLRGEPSQHGATLDAEEHGPA